MNVAKYYITGGREFSQLSGKYKMVEFHPVVVEKSELKGRLLPEAS